MAQARESRLDRANRMYRIQDAYQLAMGFEVAGTGKVRCPFGGVYHSDNRVMRLYEESNTAYCFAACGRFTPVKMVEWAKDIPRDDAVQYVLDLVGYKEQTPEERWEEVRYAEDPVDVLALEEALKVFCARTFPDWEAQQFDERTAKKLSKCLSALKKVKDTDTGKRWLVVTKKYMAEEANQLEMENDRG